MATKTDKTVALPRVRNVGKAKVVTPATSTEKGQSIINSSAALQFQTVKNLRDSGRVLDAIFKLAQINGATSTAVFDFVAVADSGFKIKAYDSSTHQFSADGANLAASVLASMSTLYDYTKGYSDRPSIGTLIPDMLQDVVLTGGIGAELVLNKSRFPEKIVPFSYAGVNWVSDGAGGRYPAQSVDGSNEVELNYPTVWVSELHKLVKNAYASSMLEACLNDVFYFLEFVEDMRRVLRSAGSPRLVLKLDFEAIAQTAGQETRNDESKMVNYMEARRKEVETVVNGLQPEEAIITYNTCDIDSISATGDKADYKELLNALSGIMATSLKSHPSILGLRIGGSQSLSNTESLIYLKVAKEVQKPVAEVMSRALTLACRLYGADVYVNFVFNPIDLRPELELEAFKTMGQQRVLELLSLGFISDDEAAMELGTGVRPPGSPKLSGTGFYRATDIKQPSPNADPMGKAMQPDTPNKAGGESQ